MDSLSQQLECLHRHAALAESPRSPRDSLSPQRGHGGHGGHAAGRSMQQTGDAFKANLGVIGATAADIAAAVSEWETAQRNATATEVELQRAAHAYTIPHEVAAAARATGTAAQGGPGPAAVGLAKALGHLARSAAFLQSKPESRVSARQSAKVDRYLTATLTAAERFVVTQLHAALRPAKGRARDGPLPGLSATQAAPSWASDCSSDSDAPDLPVLSDSDDGADDGDDDADPAGRSAGGPASPHVDFGGLEDPDDDDVRPALSPARPRRRDRPTARERYERRRRRLLVVGVDELDGVAEVCRVLIVGFRRLGIARDAKAVLAEATARWAAEAQATAAASLETAALAQGRRTNTAFAARDGDAHATGPRYALGSHPLLAVSSGLRRMASEACAVLRGVVMRGLFPGDAETDGALGGSPAVGSHSADPAAAHDGRRIDDGAVTAAATLLEAALAEPSAEDVSALDLEGDGLAEVREEAVLLPSELLLALADSTVSHFRRALQATARDPGQTPHDGVLIAVDFLTEARRWARVAAELRGPDVEPARQSLADLVDDFATDVRILVEDFQQARGLATRAELYAGAMDAAASATQGYLAVLGIPLDDGDRALLERCFHLRPSDTPPPAPIAALRNALQKPVVRRRWLPPSECTVHFSTQALVHLLRQGLRRRAVQLVRIVAGTDGLHEDPGLALRDLHDYFEVCFEGHWLDLEAIADAGRRVLGDVEGGGGFLGGGAAATPAFNGPLFLVNNAKSVLVALPTGDDGWGPEHAPLLRHIRRLYTAHRDEAIAGYVVWWAQLLPPWRGVPAFHRLVMETASRVAYKDERRAVKDWFAAMCANVDHAVRAAQRHVVGVPALRHRLATSVTKSVLGGVREFEQEVVQGRVWSTHPDRHRVLSDEDIAARIAAVFHA